MRNLAHQADAIGTALESRRTLLGHDHPQVGIGDRLNASDKPQRAVSSSLDDLLAGPRVLFHRLDSALACLCFTRQQARQQTGKLAHNRSTTSAMMQPSNAQIGGPFSLAMSGKISATRTAPSVLLVAANPHPRGSKTDSSLVDRPMSVDQSHQSCWHILVFN